MEGQREKKEMNKVIRLVKDNKLICNINCINPPDKLPTELVIDSTYKRDKCDVAEFPHFPVEPSKNCTRRYEWGNFLAFLHKNNRVAVANFERYKFYFLAPIDSKSSTINVAYESTNVESGSHLAVQSGGHNTMKAKGPPNGGDATPSQPKFPPGEDRAYPFVSETGSGIQTRMMQDRLRGKNYVKIDPGYLKTLAQTHSGWVFGGIAELVDNSRDAKATKIDIFVEMIKLKKYENDVSIPMLSVIDDGQGMNHDEIVKMVSLGHKNPDFDDKDQIGRFGVGFKTGAMRLGRDALVLTQTANSRSIALLSQSLNVGKDNIEIPIVSYCLEGQRMDVDKKAQSESLAKLNLKAIQDKSPFDKFLIGEKCSKFNGQTGTQIYIWNLDEWGSECCLEWNEGLKGGSSVNHGDIVIRNKRSRARLGQLSQKVAMDYSLRAYLEVIFLVPRMKIYVQGELVNSRPLANFLTNTVIVTGEIVGRPVELILGFSQLEWDQANCGVFLYWHGRLIEAYKRVGNMIHNADVGRGVIGVIDVTNLMDDQDGRVWVLNNKQGFEDCQALASLEEWLHKVVNEYWDKKFDPLRLDKEENCVYKPDSEWVQCDKCRKWRMLPPTFVSKELPAEWFCFMDPFKGKCTDVEQKVKPGIVNVSTKRSGYDCVVEDSRRIDLEPDTNITKAASKRSKKVHPRNEDASGSGGRMTRSMTNKMKMKEKRK